MGRIWITSGLVLCLLIPWNCAKPSPYQKGNEDDDEIDSDEQEFNRLQQAVVDRLGLNNMTNQQIAAQAQHFLSQYFNSVGNKAPLDIPNNSNHTIIITIVPNSNGSSTAGGSSYLFQMGQQNPIPNYITPPPRSVPEKHAEAVSVAATTTSTSTAEPPRPTPFLPPANKGVDNIEDAILEALSFVQGQVPSNVAGPDASITQQQASIHSRPPEAPSPPSGSSQSQQNNNNNNNGFSLSAPFPISPKHPDNDGSVYVQQIQQQPIANAPPPPQQPPPPRLPPSPANNNFQPNTPSPIIFVALPPQQASTERQTRPTGPNPLFLGLNIFGNLADGDLGAALEDTLKLAETPVVQDTTRLAAVGILHNVFQGFNCQVFGNCNRAPLKVIVP